MTVELDIAANRRARKWTKRELLKRAIWEVLGQRLFAWSPRPFWGWRRLVLRLFGARIGKHVNLHPSVRIAIPWNLEIYDYVGIGNGVILYSLATIKIGTSSTISQYAHLCAGTHDFRKPSMPLIKVPIEIGDQVWVCADAFIGPGVKVGDCAVIGARAVVTRDVGEDSIVAGNPSKIIGHRHHKVKGRLP